MVTTSKKPVLVIGLAKYVTDKMQPAQVQSDEDMRSGHKYHLTVDTLQDYIHEREGLAEFPALHQTSTLG